MAIDWVTKNVYWTDGLYKIIGVASGRFPIWKAVVDNNLSAPRDVVVNPVHRWVGVINCCVTMLTINHTVYTLDVLVEVGTVVRWTFSAQGDRLTAELFIISWSDACIDRNYWTRETCNLARTDLLMKSDHTPKTRSVWRTLLTGHNRPPKKWTWIRYFQIMQMSLTAHGRLVNIVVDLVTVMMFISLLHRPT